MTVFQKTKLCLNTNALQQISLCILMKLRNMYKCSILMHAASHFYGWHFTECPKQGYIFMAIRRLQLGELCRPLPIACSGFHTLSCTQFSSALGFSLCIHSLRIDQVCAFSCKHIEIAWDIQSYRFDVLHKKFVFLSLSLLKSNLKLMVFYG